MEIRVYYEDTDVGGVVYYANYLKFCERARSEAFFQKGISPFSQDGHFFVKNLKANYKSSAKLGDILEVTAKIIEIKTASFVLFQEVLKDGKKLFEMEITLVSVDKDGKVKKISPKQKQLIEEFFS
jgi:acyl-CoA thioester hydrolase